MPSRISTQQQQQPQQQQQQAGTALPTNANSHNMYNSPAPTSVNTFLIDFNPAK